MTDATTTTTDTAAADAAAAAAAQQAAAGVPNPAQVAAQQAAATAAAQAAAAAGTNPDEASMAAWPEEARKEVLRLRKREGDERIQSKENAKQDVLKAVLKGIGVEIPGEEKVTPEQLTSQVETERTAAREATLQRDTALEAWKAGLQPGQLDYLNYKLARSSDYAALDPKASDYGTKLAAAIASLTAADPMLKPAGTVQASGGDGFGGADGKSPVTKEQFAAMSVADRTNLYYTDKATYDRLVAER